MTPAGRPDPDAFASVARELAAAGHAAALLHAKLRLSRLGQLARVRLHPDLVAFMQALGSADVTATDPQGPDDAAGPWVSTAEAADAVGCTDRYVRQLARRGVVGARRHGARAWSVDLASLHRYLAECHGSSAVGTRGDVGGRLVPEAGTTDQRRTA